MASMDNNGDLGHQEMHCSFCHKSRSQVSKLVQGPNGVFICDECIRACADMIGQPVDELNVDDIVEVPEEAPIKELPTPHEIYDELLPVRHGPGAGQARHERGRLQPLPPHPLR